MGWMGWGDLEVADEGEKDIFHPVGFSVSIIPALFRWKGREVEAKDSLERGKAVSDARPRTAEESHDVAPYSG